MMEQVKNHYDIRANRKLLNTINTNISTLKCYNVGLTGPGCDAENNIFLVEMEGKIPHDTSIKWEEEKEKLRDLGEDITIGSFIEFYSKQINMEENAQYLRKSVLPEGRFQRSQEKALVLHTKVSNGKAQYQKKYP